MNLPDPKRDNYISLTVIGTGMGIVVSFITVMQPIFSSLTSVENRLTKLETRLETLQDLKEKVDDLDNNE